MTQYNDVIITNILKTIYHLVEDLLYFVVVLYEV